MDTLKQIRRTMIANNLRTSIKLYETNPNEITLKALKQDKEMAAQELELLKQERAMQNAETVTQAIL